MILGVFWCQRDKLWLRFSENAIGKVKVISAEIAQATADKNTTDAWQPISKGAWPTSYVYGSAEPLSTYYSFDNGVLYKTDGSLTGLNTLLAGVRKGGDWHQHNVERFNPFPEDIKDNPELSPYDTLPLTPEMFVEKEKIEQEARILRQEQDAEKWEKYQNSDIHRYGLQFASLFAEPAQELLLDRLNSELLDVDVKNYSCVDYLNILKTIIEDDSNSNHQKIIYEAATTHFDQMLDVDLQREELFEAKKAFYFSVLREEATYIANEFGIECTILNAQKTTKKQAPEQIERNNQPIDFNNDWGFDVLDQINPIEQNVDVELQRAMEVSIQHQNEEQNMQLQQAMELSLQNTQREEEDDEVNLQQAMNLSLQSQNNDDETHTLKSIQTAVSLAQAAYARWYKSGDNLRGFNGYFTFFRHGENGQIRAADLTNNIINTQDINSAIDEVNEFLRSNATKYNRHSFASFLLDELKQLENNTWNKITYIGDSNLYDKDTVIEHLVSQNIGINI